MEKITQKELLNVGIAVTVFATAFYFVFLRKSNKPIPVNRPAKGGNEPIKEKYCSPSGENKVCIEGYDLPKDIDRLNFINNKIEVTAKPDYNALGLEKGKTGFFSRVSANKLSHKGINEHGRNFKMMTDYDNIRYKVVLTDKKYLRS